MSVRIGILSVLSVFTLASCKATPGVHLRTPGTNMEISQPAQLAVGQRKGDG